MPGTPEAQARQEIDRLLMAAGWHVCGVKDANITAARGVAIREFPLAPDHGYADYLLYVDGKAAGVVEAKKVGATLTGVEIQFGRYAYGLSATPSKQSFGFFNQNLVMEYGHPQAVKHGVNVNYDVYRIEPEVTETGAKVEVGYWLKLLDQPTRESRTGGWTTTSNTRRRS